MKKMLTSLLILIPALTAVGAPSSLKGKALFQAKGCVACHTLGQGDRSGPDLKGVTKLRDKAWLERWIKDPAKMIAAKDPIIMPLVKKYITAMPTLFLTQDEVESLIAYLETNP